MLITLMRFLGAVSYLVQLAPVVNGVVGAWTSKPVPGILPRKSGYSDWGESNGWLY
jgi:hypothetical protein